MASPAAAMEAAMVALQGQLDQAQSDVRDLTQQVATLTNSHTHLYNESSRLFQKRFDEIAALEQKLQATVFKQQFDLLDLKSMHPEKFAGARNEPWRPWARKFKAYCNGRSPGFRAALDWAETQTAEITSLSACPWPAATHSAVACSSSRRTPSCAPH